MIRGEIEVNLDEHKWILELYHGCGHILTDDEKAIYFAHEFDFVDSRIKNEFKKMGECLDSSLGLIRYSESILNLACQRAVPKECVDIAAYPKLKKKFDTIPMKKKREMQKLEEFMFRELQKA